VGYTAQLWKVVTENGVEVSREVINKSTYKMTPRTASVGVSTDNPTYAARMEAAIASGSIDTCKAEAAAIKAEMEAAAAQQQADADALAAQAAALAAAQAAAAQAAADAAAQP
jgi:regulator of protease activity HflC (stomatin/prohibitin superfamily)